MTATIPNLGNFYGRTLADITPGAYDFTLELLRAGYKPLDLAASTPSLEWTDEGAVMGASATIRQPDKGRIWLARGHELRLTAHWDTHQWQVWDMRCKEPTEEDGLTLNVEAYDNLQALRRAVLRWSFPRRKGSHPNGWTADEIARFVCRRLGVKVHKLLKGTKKLHTNMVADGLKVITWAYEQEHKGSGAQVIFRMTNGALEVTQIQRNPMLYVFGSQLQSALTSAQQGEAYPVTVIEGYAHQGNGHEQHKLHHVEYNKQIVKQIGYRPAVVRFGRCEGGMPELIQKCKRRLAQDLRLIKTATIVTPGVPFIRRGEGVMLDLPQQGFSKNKAFVYASAVKNSLSGGAYTTELQVTAIDPFASKAQLELLYDRASQLSESGGVPQIGPGEE